MAAEKAPVDPAVFGAVQLIYIARPGFGHGLHDPVPRRSGIWQGEVDTVAVPDLLPEPDTATLRERAAAFGPAEGLEELCDALRARLAGELHVREHLLQAARAYVRQHGPNIDQAALVEALEARRARIPDPGRGCSLRRRQPGRLRRPAGTRRDLDAVRPTAAPGAAEALLRRRKAPTASRCSTTSDTSSDPGSAASTSMRSPAARSQTAALPRSQPKGWRRWRRSTSMRRPPRRQAEIRRRKAADHPTDPREVLLEFGLDRLPKSRRARSGHRRARHRQEPHRGRGDRLARGQRRDLVAGADPRQSRRAGGGVPGACHQVSMTARVVRGRGAPDPRTRSEAMCPRHEVVTRAAPDGRQRPVGDLRRRLLSPVLMRLSAPGDDLPRGSGRAVPHGARLSVAAMPGTSPRLRHRRRERDRQSHRDHLVRPGPHPR